MPKPANTKNFYDNWKDQIDAYWENHNLESENRGGNQNKLIIKHTPEPTENDPEPKPQILFTIIKEDGEYYYQEGDEDKQLITRETLEYSAKKNKKYENKHEAVGLFFKFFYQDNQKHRSRFWPRLVTLLLSGSIGGLLGLIVGLLGTAAIIAGSVAIPLTAVSFAISAPIFVPILVAVAVGLLATFATYKGLTALYRPDIMPHPFDNNLKPPKTHYRKSLWRYLLLSPLSMINNAAKWLARSIIVDTVLFKYTVGVIIAFIANKGNEYYKVPAQNLTGILSNLIFVGGTEPINIVDKDDASKNINKNDILLGPILSEQYRQFIEFKKEKEAQFARYHVRVNNETFLTCYRANNYDAIKQYNQANTNKTPIDVPDTASDDIKSANAKKEVVIYFCGNSSGGPQLADEALKRLKKRAKVLTDQHGESLEPTALETIIFSYPGVLNSTGQVTKADHLLQSTIAVVNNLLDEGYNINNIHLDGMSLGGANEIHLAYYFEQRGAQFKTVIASRTFSSTLATGMHYVSKLPIVGQPLCYALLPFIAFGLWAVNWQMFSDFKYWSLNSDKKWFFTAQSPGKVNQYFQANPTKGTSSQDLVLPTKSGGLYFGPIMRLERFCKKLYFVLSGNAWEYKKINNAHKLMPVQLKESSEDEIDEISVKDKATLHYVPGMEVHSEIPHGGKNKNKAYLAVRGTKKSLPIGKISQVSYNNIDTKGEEYPILCSQRDAIEYMTRGGIGLFKNRVKQTAPSDSSQQEVLDSQLYQ